MPPRPQRQLFGHQHRRAWLVGIIAAVLLPLMPPQGRAEDHGVAFMYHRFGEDRFPSTSVRLEQFEAHLEFLAENDFQVWPVSRILQHVERGEALPERTVAITIDDAYLSVYTEAYPRLKARGWPFTVFVASDSVDRALQGFMSWEHMREMKRHGASFANHSATHDYLVRRQPGEDEQQWLARVRADIERGEQRLRAELGPGPALFAYPYGEYNTALAELVAELGYTAFGQHSGVLSRYADKRALPRFPVNEDYGAPQDFAAKARMRALPVVRYTPWDPVLSADRQPVLTVELAPTDLLREELTCYVSGQGRVDVTWLDQDRIRFTVQAPKALPTGRSRYNCTAPDRQRRFYWFSHQWVVVQP